MNDSPAALILTIHTPQVARLFGTNNVMRRRGHFEGTEIYARPKIAKGSQRLARLSLTLDGVGKYWIVLREGERSEEQDVVPLVKQALFL